MMDRMSRHSDRSQALAASHASGHGEIETLGLTCPARPAPMGIGHRCRPPTSGIAERPFVPLPRTDSPASRRHLRTGCRVTGVRVSRPAGRSHFVLLEALSRTSRGPSQIRYRARQIAMPTCSRPPACSRSLAGHTSERARARSRATPAFSTGRQRSLRLHLHRPPLLSRPLPCLWISYRDIL